MHILADNPIDLDRPGEIVFGGVPFPRGGLLRGGAFALRDDSGREFPVEGTPAAFWPDGSVKWLHLCGHADLHAGRNLFDLVPASGATQPSSAVRCEPPAAAAVSGVAQPPSAVAVVSGVAQPPSAVVAASSAAQPGNAAPSEPPAVHPLSSVVGRPSSSVHSALCALHPAFCNLRSPGLSIQMTLADPDGRPRASLPWVLGSVETLSIPAPAPVHVEPLSPFPNPESPNPNPAVGALHALRQSPRETAAPAHRTVHRLSGRFVEAGRDVAELILFIETFGDLPRVGLQPVWIYLGDPDRDLVASLTLTVHTPFNGDDARYAFSADRGPGYRDVMQPIPGGPRWPLARQVQLGSSFFVTEKRTTPQSSWVKAVEGRRSQGWCHLANARGGLTAAMRYYWQEYPRSLAIDADAGDITFGLIPPESAPLDLRRYSPTRWGPLMYEHLEGPFPAQTHGATGIGKAGELMLHFHASPTENPAEAAMRFLHPARIVPAPETLAQSRALGVLSPAPAPGYEALESDMAALVDFLVRERDVRGWYGLMNFGDVMIAYYSDKDRWAFDDGGYAWLNTEGLPDLGLWLSALRCGRRDWLDAAIEMTRHNRDVDTYHRGNFRGNGTRHNVNHWGCNDKEWRVVVPVVRRLHYYLTGDPWTREVILNTVAAWQSYERTASSAPSISSALGGLLVKHELTGDPADEAVLRRMADLYARLVRADGHFIRSVHVNLATGEGYSVDDSNTLDNTYFFLNLFGGQHILVEIAELLDHKPLTDALIRYADLCLANVEGPTPYRGVDRAAHNAHPADAVLYLALALRATGDARYRNALRAFLADPHAPRLETVGGTGPLDEPLHLALAGARRKNKITCDIGRVLHLCPYGLAAVDPKPTEKP